GQLARRADDLDRHQRADRADDRSARRRHLDHAHQIEARRGHRARALARGQDHHGEGLNVSAIPILRLGHVLLVNVNVELDDEIATRMQNDVLLAIERWEAEGLVIDISGLEVVDSYVARILAETGQMTKLMGTRCVVCGMRPEVAATLTRMGYPMSGVMTALNLADGL